MAAGDPGEHEQRQGIAGGRARGWERQQGAAVGTGRGMGTATMDCMGDMVKRRKTPGGIQGGTCGGIEDGLWDCRGDGQGDGGRQRRLQEGRAQGPRRGLKPDVA